MGDGIILHVLGQGFDGSLRRLLSFVGRGRRPRGIMISIRQRVRFLSGIGGNRRYIMVPEKRSACPRYHSFPQKRSNPCLRSTAVERTASTMGWSS